MKWILLGLLVSNTLWAETSKIIPTVLEAAELYAADQDIELDGFYLRPDLRAALKVLKDEKINPEVLMNRVMTKGHDFELREDDEFDSWTHDIEKNDQEVPEVALHAYKLDVITQNGTWFKDDIYTYFFITDGVIPTGKVSSIYKGVGSGRSFFFTEVDRAIFPLAGLGAKKPQSHLIVDYGIIESNGDDVKEMQKLSNIIIDIAIAVYQAYDPENSQVIVNLRKEIKALADLLIGLKKDDRMATGTFGFKANEIAEILKDESYHEFKKNHSSNENHKKWEYEMSFRLLRN